MIIQKIYQKVTIKTCNISAGGSFLIGVDTEEDVKNLTSNWNKELFGGNKEVATKDCLHKSGIIKHVYMISTEEEISKYIRQNYAVSHVEYFKINEVFTGTVKDTFQNREELLKEIEHRRKFYENRYIIEEFHSICVCERATGNLDFLAILRTD